ncbi:2'-5' RNA ligase family protein [Dyella silvatica]|uniref:2'-5' RNA ligase family protein n=1 Tax=Dyella silvatica TaxID=2992128 RepID=UPI00224DEEC9|nr:2'-5' RNA ligase family protein [Dyella silvatica]
MSPSRSTSDSPQLDLLGGSQAMPAEIHRLFFALVPDLSVRKRIAGTAKGLPQRATTGAQWRDPSLYHGTLHFLGDHPMLRQDLVSAAIAAADKVAISPFEWVLDQVVGFRGRQPPCVLCGRVIPEPMQRLWQDLRHALILAGLGRHLEKNFTPHVTLAYIHGEVREPMAIEPVVWPIAGFELIHSVTGRGRYETLAAWHG